MIQKKFIPFLLLCSLLITTAITHAPGELNGVASGSIYLTSNDLSTAGPTKNYSVTFTHPPGTAPCGYGLGN